MKALRQLLVERKTFQSLNAICYCSYQENRARFRICSPNRWPFSIFSFLFLLDCSHTVSIAKFIYICLGIIRFCCISSLLLLILVLVLLSSLTLLFLCLFFLFTRAKRGFQNSQAVLFFTLSLSFSLFSLKIINKIAHDFVFYETSQYTSTTNKMMRFLLLLFFFAFFPLLFWAAEKRRVNGSFSFLS